MLTAAPKGDITTCKKQKEELETLGKLDRTPLLLALDKRKTDRAQELVLWGANLLQVDLIQWTCLHFIALGNLYHFYDWLIAQKKKWIIIKLLNKLSGSQDTALMIAARNQHREIFERLCNLNFEVDNKIFKVKKLLALCLQNDDVHCLKILLNFYKLSHFTNKAGDNIVHLAIRYRKQNRWAVISYLKNLPEAEPLWEEENKKGQTPWGLALTNLEMNMFLLGLLQSKVESLQLLCLRTLCFSKNLNSVKRHPSFEGSYSEVASYLDWKENDDGIPQIEETPEEYYGGAVPW